MHGGFPGIVEIVMTVLALFVCTVEQCVLISGTGNDFCLAWTSQISPTSVDDTDLGE
jgi:hypothetical protein